MLYRNPTLNQQAACILAARRPTPPLVPGRCPSTPATLIQELPLSFRQRSLTWVTLFVQRPGKSLLTGDEPRFSGAAPGRNRPRRGSSDCRSPPLAGGRRCGWCTSRGQPAQKTRRQVAGILRLPLSTVYCLGINVRRCWRHATLHLKWTNRRATIDVIHVGNIFDRRKV